MIGVFYLFLDLELKMSKGLITHKWYIKQIHSFNIIHRESAGMIRDKLNVLTNMFFTTICNCNKLQHINEGITKLTEISKKMDMATLKFKNV